LALLRVKCLLGDWIEKKGLTQAEYGRMTNRSPRMISYLCNNERPMHPEDIYYAETILGISFKDLYVFKVSK